MTAEELHKNLVAAGFTLRADGETLRVSPASRLGQGLQRLIRQHKAALLDLLAPPALTTEERESIEEAIEERAGILEHDADMSRPEAEAQAASAMRVYRLLVSMGEGAPGCDLAEAERGARLKFGSRLLAVIPNTAPGATFTTESSR